MIAAAGVLDATERTADCHPGPITYLPGAVIVREGEYGGCAYLIESGEVRVSKRIGGTDRDIAVLAAGELIGEMAPVDGELRSATVTAITQVEVVPIGRAHLEGVIEQSDPLLNVMLRTVFSRMRSLQRRVFDGATVQPLPGGVESGLQDERCRQALAAASERLKLERALTEALRRREFVLYLQPIVELADREVIGFEALIRWVRPDVGMVPPFEFVSSAERTGLIVPIGLWILEQAGFLQQRLENTVRATGRRRPPLFISVNVSARQLRSREDVDAMCSAIRASGIPPAQLKLEITENVLVENADVAVAGLERFRDMGVGIAIDDFGTGYSSLSYLHRYPVGTLKVDRSFVSSMLASQQSRKLTRSIIALARGLDMDVVAEGIEREEEVEMLRGMGCPSGQGYLFAKPLPLADAERLLSG